MSRPVLWIDQIYRSAETIFIATSATQLLNKNRDVTIALKSKFGVYEWKRLSEACHRNELVIDLSNVEFAYPPGIVALCLTTNYRGQKGKSTELTLPEAPEEDDF